MTGGGLALWWVERYTRGMGDGPRAARRAEIASDVWEQRAAAETGPVRTEIAIASRCLRGVAADLGWRHGQRERNLPRARTMLHGAGWVVWGAVLAGLVAVHAWMASLLLRMREVPVMWDPAAEIAAARASAVILAVLVLGTVLLPRHARAGGVLLPAGAVATAAVHPWAAVVLVPVAVTAGVGAVVLTRRRTRLTA